MEIRERKVQNERYRDRLSRELRHILRSRIRPIIDSVLQKKKMNDTDQAIIFKKYEKKIIEAFEIFDHTGNKTIDIREIATVLCSLGCVPSKTEINEIVRNIQEPENRGNIHLSKFLPFVSNVIQKCRFHPASAEELLKAFQIFDKDNTGYLSSDLLTKIMTERGECFSKEELNEMMTVAGNSTPGSVFYELYINHLMVSIY